MKFSHRIGLAFLFMSSPLAQAETHALLIGVGDYQPEDNRLYSPPHDVKGLQEVLLRHGLSPSTITTLIDRQANKTAILQALDKLSDNSKPGDKIFIYFSGHGTSAYDRELSFPLPQSTGAWVPHGFRIRSSNLDEIMGDLIVGKWDLRPKFEKLEQGRQIMVVTDACFSRNSARGPGAGKRHYYPIPSKEGDKREETPSPYPYSNLLYLGAADKNEWAYSPKSMGYSFMTDGLIQFLQGKLAADSNEDGRVSQEELRHVLTGHVQKKTKNQNPQILPERDDAAAPLRQRSFFIPIALPDGQVGAGLPGKKVLLRLEQGSQDIEPRLAGLAGVKITRDAAELILTREAGSWHLRLPGGQLFSRFQEGEEPVLLRLLGHYRQLQALIDAPAKGRGERVAVDYIDGLATPAKSRMKNDEAYQLKLSSPSPRYLLLLEINPHGAIRVVYPLPNKPIVPISGNQPLPLNGEIVTQPFGSYSFKLLGFSQKPPLLDQLPIQEPILPGSPLYDQLLCLVGLAPGCSGVERAEDRLTFYALPE